MILITTAYEILMKEISLILPNFSKDRKEKRSITTSLETSFISLAYEGISSYLHNKRQKALCKAFMAMNNKINIEWNTIFYLEISMVMYGIYNSDTLEKLINTVHKMHNTITWNEKIFASKPNHWYQWYLPKDGVAHYAINSLLYFITLKEKYIKTYEKFISHFWMYAKVIRVLS